jgi:hypothetical protein
MANGKSVAHHKIDLILRYFLRVLNVTRAAGLRVIIFGNLEFIQAHFGRSASVQAGNLRSVKNEFRKMATN